MSVPHPLEYGKKKAIFQGEEPDIPLTLATVLESRYLAYFAGLEDPRFVARLEHDPRMRQLYDGLDVLVEVVPDANHSFVLDWEARREGDGEWVRYPRADSPQAQVLEGYVDARRVVPAGGCVLFRRRWQEDGERSWSAELAPYGPTALSLDGSPMLSVGGSLGAVLGRGVVLARELGPGDHVLEILTCPSSSPSGECGFYLRDLSRGM
jgi:hypothetical protein